MVQVEFASRYWRRAGNVRANTRNGDVINDLHLAVCELVSKKASWVVKTNPYEGGSDHTVFGSAGVPSLLNWHFTDRYYHSNLDTPDKTSAYFLLHQFGGHGLLAHAESSRAEARGLRTVSP